MSPEGFTPSRQVPSRLGKTYKFYYFMAWLSRPPAQRLRYPSVGYATMPTEHDPAQYPLYLYEFPYRDQSRASGAYTLGADLTIWHGLRMMRRGASHKGRLS